MWDGKNGYVYSKRVNLSTTQCYSTAEECLSSWRAVTYLELWASSASTLNVVETFGVSFMSQRSLDVQDLRSRYPAVYFYVPVPTVHVSYASNKLTGMLAQSGLQCSIDGRLAGHEEAELHRVRSERTFAVLKSAIQMLNHMRQRVALGFYTFSEKSSGSFR